MTIELNKSRYCKWIQCPKILWMDQYMPEQAKKTASDSVMSTGIEVGELARDYFGSYALIEFDKDKSVMAEKTRQLLEQGVENIAEAAFLCDGLYCAVDILHRDDDNFDIVEGKSSTKVSEIYIEDLSFQYYVLKKCGIPIRKAYILHLDNSYVRHGGLELDKLFALEDNTEAVAQRSVNVGENIARIYEYIDTDSEPEQDIGLYCDTPYPCAYYGYCARHIPEPSIFSVSRLTAAKKYEYYREGIVTFEDIIRKNLKLNSNQTQQVETAYYHRPDAILPEKIREFLDTLSYPLYHLDFETFQQAIPEYDGLSPYSQIPFQYSLHIEYGDGKLEHREFLAEEGKDPRRAVAESLCANLPGDVCVLAYNMSFERRVLQELADIFPDLEKHLLLIKENLHDLMVPFQKRYYYSEAMEGSYSIKYVLPALCPGDPDLDYHALEGIHNGEEASAAFKDMPNHTPAENAITRRNLLKYCRLDTLAMVKVLEKLRQCIDWTEGHTCTQN